MRIAFAMKLKDAAAAEYKQRHDDIWPELRELLKSVGISNYSIYLHPQTNLLFAHLECEDEQRLKELDTQALMHRWWDFMQPLMETSSDSSKPVMQELLPMFYME